MTFEAFKALVLENRSFRRFDNRHEIDESTLRNLVALTRTCASGANKQPLKYFICREREINERIFACLGWAAYLRDWSGPEPAERPSAYIIITGDHTIADHFWCDHGIAAQTILLGARTLGLGGCMFGSVNAGRIKPLLGIPDHLEVKLAVALGKPVETVQIDELGPDGDIRYWRDENKVHHVPKRSLDDLIAGSF